MRQSLVASLLLVCTLTLLTGCRSGMSPLAFWKRDQGQPPETTGLVASTTPTLPSAQATPPMSAQSSITQGVPTDPQFGDRAIPGTPTGTLTQTGPYQVNTQTAAGPTGLNPTTTYPLTASLPNAQALNPTNTVVPSSPEIRVPGTSASIGGSRYASGSPYDTASATGTQPQPTNQPLNVYPPTGAPPAGSQVQQAAAALTADARAGMGAVHSQVTTAVQQSPVQQVAADWSNGSAATPPTAKPAQAGNSFRPGGTSNFPTSLGTGSAPASGTYPSTGL